MSFRSSILQTLPAGPAAKRAFAPLLPLLLLGACVSVPRGDAPPAGGVGVLPAMQALASSSASAPITANAAWPGEDWWQSYGDAQLPQLINEALAHSPDVATAAARVAKARALAGVAEAALLPKLDVNGTVGLTKQSYNMGFGPAIQPYLPHGWKSEGELTATLGFDPDIWGKNRAALAAAISERNAAAIDARAARLGLAAAIADAYVGLSGDIALREVRAATLGNRADVEKLVTLRFNQGLENRATLDGARGGTATARGDLAAAEARVALRRNQLAALMGEGPDRGLVIAAPTLAPIGSRALPADVTTDLLGRRPDISAARADADLAVADYNRTVVAAYQQLADAAANFAQLNRQRDDAAAAQAANAEAFSLITARFKAGLATGLDLLASQDRLVAANAASSAADTAARQADIALIRALGGGYASHSAPNQPTSTAASPQGPNP